jgi:hypothetical protein
MSIDRFGLLLAVAISFIVPSTARGITLGQIDTFEDGTKQGWSNGSNIGLMPNGPAGSNDHYLPMIAGGSGLPSRWQISNTSQWLGNYLAAGVTGIEMDLRADPARYAFLMNVRIAIRESPSATMNAGYVSTVPFIFPMEQQWYHVSFSLLPNSLTPVGSPQPLAIDLANVADFRIISAASPATLGDDGIASSGFDVDNIRAVPEPASICLAMSATIGLILFRRRCSKF